MARFGRTLLTEEQLCPKCLEVLPPSVDCVCGFTTSVVEVRERGEVYVDEMAPLRPRAVWIRESHGVWTAFAWPVSTPVLIAWLGLVLWGALCASFGLFLGPPFFLAGFILGHRFVFGFVHIRLKDGELRVRDAIPGWLRPALAPAAEIRDVRLWTRKYSDNGEETVLQIDSIEAGCRLGDEQREYLQWALLRRLASL